VLKLWQLLEGTDTDRAVYDKIADILYDGDHEAREKIRKIIEAK